ncbi:MAG TPA: hypothetical protein DCY13_01905, partial [Verrucomicrobiales bacterium]|nr:hypothetical protein [Verrucomicrobiales bacterium]
MNQRKQLLGTGEAMVPQASLRLLGDRFGGPASPSYRGMVGRRSCAAVASSKRRRAHHGLRVLIFSALLVTALPFAVLADESETKTMATTTASPPIAEKKVESTPVNDFSTFKLVFERNIFDPNRRARARTPVREAEPEKPPRVDVISLAGVMSYGDQELAFFDSNAGEFKKALKPGESLAGYTLRQVAQDHVALEREGATLDLNVGQQLRRVEDGDWQVT